MYEGLPQAIAPMSSSSAFLGEELPFFASTTEDFLTNIEKYIGEAVMEAQTLYEERLELLLSSYPAWLPYKDMVGVEWVGDGFQFFFKGTEDQIEELRELEYGFDPDSSPKSVIRTTALEMEDRAGRLISEILNREVGLA